MSLNSILIRVFGMGFFFVINSCGPLPQPRGVSPAVDPVLVEEASAVKLLAETDSIQKLVIDKYCVACHGAEGNNNGVDLTDLKTLVTTINKIVVPKNPEMSNLYQSILSG